MPKSTGAYAFSQDDTDDILKQFLPTLFSRPEPKIDRPSDAPYVDIYSPQTFDEYIGQSEAKQLAQIMVEAAKKENRKLPNTMIVGDYGLGKTSLARVIMRAYGKPDRVIDAMSINRELPAPGSSLIIDEIHNLTPDVADSLNVVIDRNDISIIGCTTNPGALSSAFRSRFRTLFLEDYSTENLVAILSLVCKRKGIAVPNKAALVYIAQRSRLNARQAINYIQMVFDLMAVKSQRTLTEAVAYDTLGKLGVDDRGFLPRDRKYLAALPRDRAVGLQYLSAVLGVDEKTIEQEIEPFLLRMQCIDRTNRGRIRVGF